MAKLWNLLRGRSDEVSRYDISSYLRDLTNSYFSFPGYASGGSVYGRRAEDVENSFIGYVNGAYKRNGVIFAIILSRLMLFTEARFMYRRFKDDGTPGELFSDDSLRLLKKPWPNGTTGELLARMEQDVSLSGNFYCVNEGDRLRRLRPDWVTIVLSAPPEEAIEADVIGYLYHPNGYGNGIEKAYLPDEVCHFSPIPDPAAQYRGMSWLTPVVEDIQADMGATTHKLNFFRNGATPQVIATLPREMTRQQFIEFREATNSAVTGVSNAYKIWYLGGGADAKVVGTDFRQLDFKVTQGGGETRLCAAGGVPPIIVGLSEGLSSATYSNYGMARRKFGDHWARPQWRMASASLASIVAVPEDAELWYDDRDIAFLREDAQDQANISQTLMATITSGITAGFVPDEVVKYVNPAWAGMKHSGAFSVQLQPPGTEAQMAPDANNNGMADDLPVDGEPAEPAPADFGALRADFWEYEEEDLLRAVEDLFGLDDEEIERARYDVRVEGGHVGGGRFRKLSDVAAALLQDWAKGDGPDDPLEKFDRPQLLRVMGDLRKKAVDAGDHERAARLTPRRGATPDQLKEALYNDVRHGVRRDRGVGKPSAKFTLQGPDHRDLDVAVYKDKDGKPALFREGDNGKRGALVEKFDSLDELRAWANEHGEPRLADWARKESGPRAPAVKKAVVAMDDDVKAKLAAVIRHTGKDSLRTTLGSSATRRASDDLGDRGQKDPREVVADLRAAADDLERAKEADLRRRFPLDKVPTTEVRAGDATVLRQLANKLEAAIVGDEAAKPARKATPRKAATAPDPDVLDASLRDAKPEDRRALLDDAAKNQTQARRLASQLGVKGVSKLSRDEALDRIEAHYGAPKKTDGKPGAVDQARVAQIASAFHEDWRKTRLQADGTFESRVKKTKDQAWIKAHGTDDVDIANSTYDELPDDWKAENRAAAEVVAGILQRHGGKVDLSDEKTRLEVGEEVHQAWLSRNAWAAGGELDVPFADLPADEQAKDIDQVSVAMGALAPAKKAAPVGKVGGEGVPRKLTPSQLAGMSPEDLAQAAEEGRVSPRMAAAKIRQRAQSASDFGALTGFGEAESSLTGEAADRKRRQAARVAELTALADSLEAASPSPRGAAGKGDVPGDGGAPARKATPAKKLSPSETERLDWAQWRDSQEGRQAAARRDAAQQRAADAKGMTLQQWRDSQLEGLTDRQKRAKLESWGLAPATPGAAGKGVPAARPRARTEIEDLLDRDLGEPLKRRTPREGDVAVWFTPGAMPMVGRVVKVGRRTYIDWEGGRKEPIIAGKADPSVTLYPGDSELATPTAPTPDGLDSTGANGLSSDPAVRAVQVENRIRAAYRDLKPGHGFVELADLREHPALRDVPRAEQDKALLGLRVDRDPGIMLAPHDQQIITPRDRAAALDLGAGTRERDGAHMLYISDPADRPLPSSDGLDSMDEPALRKYAPRTDGGIPVGDPDYDTPKYKTGRHVARHTRQSLPTAADEQPGSRVSQAQAKIREIYDRHVSLGPADRPAREWMSLADVRDEMPEFTDEEVDKALILLNRQRDARVVPESNQVALSQREEDAAVIIGSQHRFALQIFPPEANLSSPSAQPPTKPVPAVDFLDRVHQAENAGLSAEDARAFAASGLSLEEWRAQRAPKVRPSGLPTDRRPASGDFDDLADRIMGKPEQRIYETIQDLNATELAKLARKFPGSAMHVPGSLRISDRRRGLELPKDLPIDELRRWLAKQLANVRGTAWRSEPFEEDEDDIERGRPHPGQKYRHGWIKIGPFEEWHGEDLSDKQDLVDAVNSGETGRFKLTGGEHGDVDLVDHKNGAETIEKRLGDVASTMGAGFPPELQADAEQATSTLGRAIGAPVPRALRTAPDKVTLDVVYGDTWFELEQEALATGDPKDAATLKAYLEKLTATPEGVRLGVFDLLTDNWDRNNGRNWKVDDGTHRPVGYDHAFAWSEPGSPEDPPRGSALSPFAVSFVTPPTPGQRLFPDAVPPLRWVDNPLTPADITWLRERLAEVEGDFARLGRHDWWEFASARLEAIASHATGKENVFA